MSLFKEAIDAFQAGHLDFPGLEAVLQTALQTEPGSAPGLLQLLEQAYRTGRMPPQLYVMLKSRIDSAGAGSAAAPDFPEDNSKAQASIPEAGEDATRIMAPDRSAAPPEEDSDRTVLGENIPVLNTDTSAHAGNSAHDGATGDATVITSTSADAITSRTSGSTDSSWSDLQGTQGQTGEELKPGSVLKGRFVLEEIIGRGGMGEVYKARDLRKEEAQDRNPWIAVKILNESFKAHPESLKALQRESRKAQTLAHPNIVNVHDFDRDGSNVFMTMEFLEGEPLDNVTKRNLGRGMPESDAMKIIRDMGLALAHAHKHGIVHSDFKPGNAFLTKSGVTKVFDFGIARASTHASQAEGEETLFDAGDLGALTPAYASYEMLEGDEPDARDDIYALACVAYELLAGRHPFDKTPANKALKKGMTPRCIKSLSRAQWKALEKGLAFSRGKRSANVTEFLSGLERKRLHKGLLIGAAAAFAIIAVLVVLLVPQYLHERRLTVIVRELKSRDPATVAAALETARAMEQEDRDAVLQDAKVELVDWYKLRQDELVNESLQLYNYPVAQQEIDEALKLFPDSAQIHELRDRLENSRDQLLNDLNQRFNAHLEQGRLLASEQDDMEDVLRILAQAQPGHPLLQDVRLTAAYAEQAEKLLEKGELDASKTMLVAGLQRFPQDTNLVNLNDKVTAEQSRVEQELRIAGLTEQLVAALAALNTLDAIEQVRPELMELARLDPDAPVVGKIQSKAGKLVDRDLASAMQNKSWDAGELLLQNYRDVVTPGFATSRQEKLVAARDKYLARMDSLYAALLDAVGKKKLSGKSRGSAQSIYGQLEQEGADTAMLERARASVGQGYLELARDARAQGKWDDARGYIEQGKQRQPGDSMVATLQAELDEIVRSEDIEQQQLAEAEVNARAVEKQKQVDKLYAEFKQGLQQVPYQPEIARQSIVTLDKLAAANPTDPLLAEGRGQVAGRLAGYIRSLGNTQDWDKALAASREAVELIPGSEVLSSMLVEIERGRSQQLAVKHEENVNQYKQSLAEHLAKPVLDESWTSAVLHDLKSLAEMLPQDQAPWLEEQRLQLAALYLNKAREMRGKERFSEAKVLLDSASKFVPDDPAYQSEQQALAKAEAKFLEDNKERLNLARIEGSKTTFLTQAKARDVRNAKQTLDSLRKELPESDPFLVEVAPEMLGSAYLRLAESSAKKGNYSSAIKLIDAGLKEAPSMAALQDVRVQYQQEIRIDDARKLLRTTKSLTTPKVKQVLSALKADKKVDYAKLEQEFAGIVYKRIQGLSGTDFPLAGSLLAEAQSLFPSNSKLASLKLVKPAPKAPVDVAKATTKPIAPDATDTGTEPIKEAKRVASNGVACAPSLAGYGRRARGTCYDFLPGDKRGPLLVVIPSGSGISEPYAIGKYEISVDDYNSYCKNSGKCSGINGSSGSLPVTGLSLQQVRSYASWMSSQTGYTYRLPTDQEWSHAASAQGKQPAQNHNCTVMLAGKPIKGHALGDVNMGEANGWGLKNYLGNAQELVTTASGTAARGGAYVDNLSDCVLTLTKSHGAEADNITGFRLVRSLKPGG